MHRRVTLAITLGLAFSLAGSGSAVAHDPGEAEIVVEPGVVTAGDAVAIAGTGLEPSTDRVLVLAGEDLIVELGSVKTDADGMFQIEVTVPSHLPAGIYEVRAIGDETLTTTLSVTAAGPGGAVPVGAAETIVPRERTPFELGVILALVAVAAMVGALLVWRAEQFQGKRSPEPGSLPSPRP